MADRLATLLGTESTVLVFEELLVTQDDIRSIGSLDTLLMEFEQQAFEAYLSSNSKGSVAGCTRRMLKTGCPTLSLVHTANHSSTKQSLEAPEPRCLDLPQVIGGSSPPVKLNRNAERRQ